MAFLDERIEFIKDLNEQREKHISNFLCDYIVNDISAIAEDMSEMFLFMVKLNFIKNFILNKISNKKNVQSSRAIVINWFDEYYQNYINQANNQFDTMESLNANFGGPSKDEFNMSMLKIHYEFMKNI